MGSLLAVRDLCVSYGGIVALKGVSLSVEQGEMVCVLGGNGAGKSTLLRTISCLQRASSGQIFFASQDLTGFLRKPDRLASLGIGHVPEGRRVFPGCTVRENLMLGARSARGKGQLWELYRKVMELFPELKSIETQSAWKLSGGQQQMVAVGRALMGDPKLLMLDEPSLGLAPIVARRVLERVRRLCDQGRSVLLVEQNARAALEVADRGYVLMEGEVRLEGSSSTLSEGELLQDVYLGEL